MKYFKCYLLKECFYAFDTPFPLIRWDFPSSVHPSLFFSVVVVPAKLILSVLLWGWCQLSSFFTLPIHFHIKRPVEFGGLCLSKLNFEFQKLWKSQVSETHQEMTNLGLPCCWRLNADYKEKYASAIQVFVFVFFFSSSFCVGWQRWLMWAGLERLLQFGLI